MKAGDYGWIGLTAGVIAFDALAPETLSGAVDRYLERPIGRIVAIGAIAVTGAHLMNLLPERLDPIHQGFDLLRRFVGVEDA